MPEWTAEQKQVIESRGQSLLVSAAAGSGKTAVLVQRILDKILDPSAGVDIDRMLVVTFTNAAAASLRSKIRTRLEEEAAGCDPERVRLAMRQLSMLAGDHIETIDRFCREIVLDHADALEIDPSFRIADGGEIELLQSEVVSQVIEEEADASDQTDGAFSDLARLYAPGRTDEALEGLILDFYNFSMSHEFPGMWRHRCADLYRQEADGSAWMQEMTRMIRMQLEEVRASLLEGISLCGVPGGPYHYRQAMEDHLSYVERLLRCGSAAEYADRLKDFAWPRPGSKKRGKDAPPVDETLEKQGKEIRERAKKTLTRLMERFFFAPEEQIDDMRRRTARYMDALVRLTDRFEDLFSREKAARRIADFSDVAHWALRVLICVGEDGMPVPDEEGNYVRTRLAQEYADYFQEIYIDEYQDSNRVQEILLRSISREGGRFMVGDMKQSIYRFRMADPQIFLEKAKTYREEEDAPERRIDLHQNFRSRACILDAVNLIFRQIMRAELGGVEYTKEQELRAGYRFPVSGAGPALPDEASSEPMPSAEPPSDPESPSESGEPPCEPAGAVSGADASQAGGMVPELLLAEKDDVEGASSGAEAEAVIVAERIRHMAGRMQIFDKEKNLWRPVRYQDITILLRTASGWAETFSRVLDEYGIPNRPDASTGYFDAVEVRTILAYLSILDNPRQDIPLAASLRSVIGELEDRELAVIRTEQRGGSLYDSITAYAGSGKEPLIRRKLEHFLEMTRRLRAYVKDTPIHLLLWKIFDETGYENRIAQMEGGRQKRANLALLTDMAITFEQTSYRGLFHFVRYVEKLRKAQKDIGQAPGSGGQENLVRIMTMHKSKGLEFPVVFVSGLNKGFNLQDARGRIVMHEHLGAGLDFRDPGRMGRMPNRIRSVIAQRIESDSIGEELRVLYVAMTRAEQKLILTGCVDSRQKAVTKALACRSCSETMLPEFMIRSAAGMLDWILAALSRHSAERDFFDSGRWEGLPFREDGLLQLPGRILIRTGPEVLAGSIRIRKEQERQLESLFTQSPDEVTDPALRARLDDMLSWNYTHDTERMQIPAKLSVSEIKHEAYAAEIRRIMEEEDGTPWQESDASKIPQPQFLKEIREKEKLSAAAMGSVYHLVLASLDLTGPCTRQSVQALLETMVNCDRIQKEEASRLEVGKIMAFLSSGLAGRMQAAARREKLWREAPFVVSKSAAGIRPEWSADEQVLIQGIIDAFFIEEDQVILIDYKTDTAAPGDEESLVRRYRTQFLLYADALENLLRMRVTEAWLYSLSLQKAIRVDLQGP